MYSPIINCLLLSNLILFSKAAYISNRTLLDIEDLYRTLQKDLVEYQENQSVEQPENRFTGICQNLVSCQEGEALIRRPGVVPTYNGCGTYGVIIDFNQFNAQELTLCCNSHDLCYSNCDDLKDDCDTKFYNCLETSCNYMSVKQKWNTIKNFACEEVIKLMYKAVENLGCLAYVNGIEKNCRCVDSSNF